MVGAFVTAQDGLYVGFPVFNQRGLYQVVGGRCFRGHQRVYGVTLADAVEVLFEFADLIVDLRLGCAFADHVGKAVNLRPQVACIFDNGGGILQPPREYQSQDDGQKGGADP